jgi:hypothetical protein
MQRSTSSYDGIPLPTSAVNRPQVVTGQYLARAHLTRRQRARLAAALSSDTVRAYPLTVRQAATMMGVPVVDVTKARANGKPSNGNERSSSDTETLTEHILRTPPAQRAQAAREVGLAELWDTMMSPALEEEKTAAE